MGKYYTFDADFVELLENNKKNHISEKNLIQTAVKEFLKKETQEKYEKMLTNLNLNKYDTD